MRIISFYTVVQFCTSLSSFFYRLIESKDFLPYLHSSYTGVMDSRRFLVIGCGTSRLSAEISTQFECQVVSLGTQFDSKKSILCYLKVN